MKNIYILSLLMILSLFMVVYSQIPPQMSYQGYLTDNANNPINGNHKLTFTIYDAQTAGNTLWMEEHPVVAINQGVFRVQLGSITPLNLAFDAPYWMSIKVENDPELAPRVTLSSVAYSFNSLKAESVADGSISTNSVQDGSITLPKIEPDMMVKIWEGTITNLPTYQITGLNGNLHKFYKIFFNGRIHHTSDIFLLVRPNGDDINNNYRSLLYYCGDASQNWNWLATGLSMGRSAFGGECDLSFELTLSCETGRIRFSHGEGIMGLLTDYRVLGLNTWSRWHNSTDNITSLEITSTNSAGLTTGTFSGTVIVYAVFPR